MTGDLSAFEEALGYRFSDPAYLRTALTHSSYANEHRRENVPDNERLEFLGDAVLEVSSSDYLYHKYPGKREGDLTRLRASMVCEPALALCARRLLLNEYLLLGRGEDLNGGRDRDSILSDALEAVIGAIYLDGGLSAARRFIEEEILEQYRAEDLFVDCKTILQEIAQADGLECEYRMVGETGPAHRKHYVFEVLIGGEVKGTGTGPSKKAAEQAAAEEAVRILRKTGN